MVHPQTWRFKMVATRLEQGEVIAYPTEGVWGLGCLPENRLAVDRILLMRQRSWRQGLILVGASFEQVKVISVKSLRLSVRCFGKPGLALSPILYPAASESLTGLPAKAIRWRYGFPHILWCRGFVIVWDNPSSRLQRTLVAKNQHCRS